MARKGRAGAALAIAAIGSFVAGTFSVIALQLFAPLLARSALAFGPAEYFALTVLGVVLLSNLTGKSRVKSLLMMLIGVIIASFVNMFWSNSMLYWVTTYIGIAVFVGLTAYDTQKIKEMSMAVDGIEQSDSAKKYAIFGALTLYLDFINLFLLLLRLFGGSRD